MHRLPLAALVAVTLSLGAAPSLAHSHAHGSHHKAVTAADGAALLTAHRFKEARALALRLLEKNPRDVRALGMLSDAQLELGELDAAIAAAQRMVDMKPGLASYARAAHLAWLQGDAVNAKRFYRQAIAATRPGERRAWALTQAAELFRHEGDLDGADAGYRVALDEDPDYAPALIGRARVALARERADEAVRLLRHATRETELLEARWLLADALSAAGDVAAAEVAYAAVADAGAHDRRTYARFLHATGGDAQLALRLAHRELHQRPGVTTRSVAARALLRVGRVARARAVLESTLSYGAHDSSLVLTRAALLWAEGDRAAARALAARALAQNPHVDVRGLEHVLPTGYGSSSPGS